jgi:hypothetical protein
MKIKNIKENFDGLSIITEARQKSNRVYASIYPCEFKITNQIFHHLSHGVDNISFCLCFIVLYTALGAYLRTDSLRYRVDMFKARKKALNKTSKTSEDT